MPASASRPTVSFEAVLVGAIVALALVSCSGKDAEPDPAPITTPPTVTTTSPAPPSTIAVPTTAIPAPAATPRFEPGDCVAPITLRFRHRCGQLVVPEDRDKPNGRQIRLPVVIFEAQTNKPQLDPVIYLAGGGGIDQLAMMDQYEDIMRGVLSQRDFIMFNQRGAPGAEPELECAGLSAMYWELAGRQPPVEERNLELAQFWSACQSELVGQGIDLQEYSTRANAADAADLRIALGYEEANYYGTSYGTRIGLALLRDHPDGVRSIILDSAYPPEAPYYPTYAAHVTSALTNLFEGCESDPSCADQNGDLREVFFRTVDRLDEDPVVLSYPDGSITVDGLMYLDVIYALLQSTPGRGAAVDFISSAGEGDLALFEPVYPSLFDYPGSLAVYYSFQCQEEVPKHSFDDVIGQAADLPPRIADYAVLWFAALDYAVCEVWDVQPSGAGESAPVVSEVPALVLGGEFDPITPIEWGRSAVQHLANGWFFELPGHSHGVMRTSVCARVMGLAFIEDPMAAPDLSCIDSVG